MSGVLGDQPALATARPMGIALDLPAMWRIVAHTRASRIDGREPIAGG